MRLKKLSSSVVTFKANVISIVVGV